MALTDATAAADVVEEDDTDAAGHDLCIGVTTVDAEDDEEEVDWILSFSFVSCDTASLPTRARAGARDAFVNPLPLPPPPAVAGGGERRRLS